MSFFVCLFVCFISTAALIIIIYFHFHYNVLGGYHVSDFKSLNDGLLLNLSYMLLIITVFIWQINVMLCYVMLCYRHAKDISDHSENSCIMFFDPQNIGLETCYMQLSAVDGKK